MINYTREVYAQKFKSEINSKNYRIQSITLEDNNEYLKYINIEMITEVCVVSKRWN